MATYGSGQMLGSGINPESFKQDYSGFTRAAEMQAQGITGLGKSISGVIDNFGEAKKEQKKVDAYNKASAKSIEAAITLGNSYGIAGAESTLRPFLEAYNDPNLSPIEKAALLDEGKAMVPNVFGRFDQSQANAIQKAQVDARNATPPSSFDFKEITVPHIVNGVRGTIRMLEDANSGRVRTSDGKEYSNIEDAKAGRNPIGQVNSGIDAALNLPIPPLTGNLNRDETAINNAQQLPSVNEMDNTPAIMLTGGMPDGQGNLANASPVPVGSPTVTQQPRVDGPPGFIPDEVKPVEQKTTSRIITGEEAKTRLGGDPNKRYNIEEKGKEITRFVEMPPDITPTEQRAIDEDKGKKLESKMAASAVIKTIDKFIDQNGNSNENLKSAVGYGEGLATGVSKYAPILGTQSPQNRADQKELRILVEKGLLEAAKDLKPISNTDLKLLLTNRPEITDPPELWSEFLNNLRSILNDPNSYLGSNAETQSNATPNTATPQSATEGLRALLPPQ